MSGKARVKQAIREAGPAVGIVVLAVVLTFWGSLATVQAVFLTMTLAVLLWTATTRVDRLRSAGGWPRPLLFGGMAVLAVVNASAFSFTGLAPLLVSTGVVGTALVVGLTRALRRSGA
jgi:hypothetical protein